MHLRSLWQPVWHHVTVKDNQSQSMGQCWETKIQDRGSNYKFMLLVTFIHALPKMSVHFYVVGFFFNHHLVYASLDDCLLYRMYRRKNMNAFFPFLGLTD
ncbi:hypothetical protein AMECASPLE_018212 [Ameca splendens]|uniref:Uncharacterized protein n=2 Tax=Goodeidae TaxID=28758 RepID=A0ABV0NUE7_9TELE